MNLITKLQKHLNPKQIELLNQVRSAAKTLELPLYLVGGAVRDILLEQSVSDIDLVVEGEVNQIASSLEHSFSAEVLACSQFNSIKINFLGHKIDISGSRKETYGHPGALPTIQSGTIYEDLNRRDFTINALAMRLWPSPYGDLIDPLAGHNDILYRKLRILHKESFQNDATRIMRAVRYEQRLGLQLEQETEAVLIRDLPFLETISGHRISRELTIIFQEENPIPIMVRLSQLGLLNMISPIFPIERDTAYELEEIHKLVGELQPSHYLGWIVHPLDLDNAEIFIKRLSMSKKWATITRDVISVRQRIADMDIHTSPMELYATLHRFSAKAVEIVAALETNKGLKSNMVSYLDQHQNIKPFLSGEELIELGLTQGSQVGEMLNLLIEAHIEKRVSSKLDELYLVRKEINKPDLTSSVN
jgi:tRNA nucleotidyltransferase (CCA-adding enzyme)